MRALSHLRIIPVVLLAAGGLFVLKTMGIVFDGGYTLGEKLADRHKEKLAVSTEAPRDLASPSAPPVQPQRLASGQSWAQTMFNYPDVTGSVPEKSNEPALKVSEQPPKAIKIDAASANSPERIPSAGERAILERLHERREELEARSRELEMRESLIKAAEKRLEAQVAELKETEQRIGAAVNSRNEAEAARFKSLVTMYENMKAKEAARIFDRLDMNILIDVSTQINPRRMSDILAQMSPEAAEKLTVELANRASARKDVSTTANLPKIEGRPGG